MATLSALRLVNGSTGDAALYLDFPGEDNALQLDAGELHRLTRAELQDITALLLSHHHMDHMVGLGRLIRYTLDTDKEVQVIGPPGTIERFEHALHAVQHMRFPFMKVRYLVREVHALDQPQPQARFACQQGFAREPLDDAPAARRGLLLDLPEARVRCAPASHTMPCLAYAIEVKRGYRYDPIKAAGRPLRPGRWVAEATAALRKPRASRPRVIQIDGARFELEQLRDDYLSHAPATKLAWITDTRQEPETWPGLVELARGATRLYCDAYYRAAQHKQAQTHGHLTAPQAAELATEAEVDQLWLMHLAPRYRGAWDALVAEAQAIFPRTFCEL